MEKKKNRKASINQQPIDPWGSWNRGSKVNICSAGAIGSDASAETLADRFTVPPQV